jgi:hypothetical protein
MTPSELQELQQLLALESLAAAYAGHCLSKLPDDATDDDKFAELVKAYRKARQKIPTPRTAGAMFERK